MTGTRIDLVGLDLPELVRVVPSEQGIKSFPKLKESAGTARNCLHQRPDHVRVLIDGRSEFTTWHRKFWRLAE